MAPLLPSPALLSKPTVLALAHAHVAHLNAQGPPPRTQRWVVSEPVEYTPYWYFDYQTDLPADQALDLANVFGYPPGYLIWKQTQACTLVGWAEYPTLAQREQLYQQAYHLAQWLMTAPPSLARLRPHLRLPLPELAPLSHALRALADPAAQVMYLFPYLHAQALREAQLAPLPILPLDK